MKTVHFSKVQTRNNPIFQKNNFFSFSSFHILCFITLHPLLASQFTRVQAQGGIQFSFIRNKTLGFTQIILCCLLRPFNGVCGLHLCPKIPHFKSTEIRMPWNKATFILHEVCSCDGTWLRCSEIATQILQVFCRDKKIAVVGCF